MIRKIGGRARLIGLAAAILTAAAAAAQSPPSLAGGAYSASQSAHGAEVYAQHCASCHGKVLTEGSAPPLTGPFWNSWSGRSLAELYQLIQGAMPADAPSSLSDADYAAVVAHMLKVGGYPAGSADLPASPDALAPIKIGPPR
jgi:mono/diheme cytochrome c family protein